MAGEEGGSLQWALIVVVAQSPTLLLVALAAVSLQLI